MLAAHPIPTVCLCNSDWRLWPRCDRAAREASEKVGGPVGSVSGLGRVTCSPSRLWRDNSENDSPTGRQRQQRAPVPVATVAPLVFPGPACAHKKKDWERCDTRDLRDTCRARTWSLAVSPPRRKKVVRRVVP